MSLPFSGLIKCIRKSHEIVYSYVDPIGYARSIGVRVGKDCRLIGVHFGSEPFLVTLGDHVSAADVTFITHDGGIWVFRDTSPEVELFGPITVGNNVFLGAGVRVLPGVTIGDNVVIGAGAWWSAIFPPIVWPWACLPSRFERWKSTGPGMLTSLRTCEACP